MGGRRSVSGSAERPCGYNESGGGGGRECDDHVEGALRCGDGIDRLVTGNTWERGKEPIKGHPRISGLRLQYTVVSFTEMGKSARGSALDMLCLVGDLLSSNLIILFSNVEKHSKHY